MTAIPNGAHTLTIASRTGYGFKSGFDATCTCGAWRYVPRNYTLQEARESHDAHLQAVIAAEDSALDRIAIDARIRDGAK